MLAAGVELVELGVGIVDIRACSSALPPPVSLILINLFIRISMSVKLEPLLLLWPVFGAVRVVRELPAPRGAG